jgi:hypothetical protein
MKSFFMYKVTCQDCGRMRLWDDKDDFNHDTCPECASKFLTVRKVEVT